MRHRRLSLRPAHLRSALSQPTPRHHRSQTRDDSSAYLSGITRLIDISSKWCYWIKQGVFGGTISAKVNNKIGSYIKSFKRVWQGDLLSLILFNFVADCLTRMVHKAQENNLVTRLIISHIIPKGVAILQYADDTILFLKHDLEGATHMKLLLYLFEMLASWTEN